MKQTRFLAVVGPSGSGKSSVVRAGLIPALRRGAIDGSEGWHIADMFPGARPLDGLEAALLRAAPDPPASLMEQLERDEHGLHRAVLRLLPSDGSELVLVIDQFEEVFTLVEDEAVRTHFLGSLEAAATDPRSRLRVVVTLRADFYDRPLLYRGFAELFKSRVEAVVPLSAEELERAISGPAKRVDVSLEPGLVAAMLADVAEEPGALPLMEYALTELFERRDGRTLFLEAYRQIGGVSGALGRRAEELYADLDDDGQEAARQLFLRLVALGEGTEDTRRRVPRCGGRLARRRPAGDDHGPRHVRRLAAALVRPRRADRRVRRSSWRTRRSSRRGRGCIAGSTRRARTSARSGASSTAAKEWIEADREPSFLLAGSRLEQAESWRGRVRRRGDAGGARVRRRLPRGAGSATGGGGGSRSARTRSRAPIRPAAPSDRRRSSPSAALVAAGLTVFATGQQGKAQAQERNATARELAAASVANLEVDPERSILLALEAIDETRAADGTVLPEAEEALHRAVIASRLVLTEQDLGGTVDWSPEGVFVTEGPENTGTIDLRDATTGDSVRSWTGHENSDVNDVRFSPDGSMLATTGDDGLLKMWDPDTGELIASVSGTTGAVGQSFDADGTLVAAAWPEDDTVRVAEAATGSDRAHVRGIGHVRVRHGPQSGR